MVAAQKEAIPRTRRPVPMLAPHATWQALARSEAADQRLTIDADVQARLEALMERYPFIGHVRGKGLLLAFEMVSDRATMAPLPKEWNAYSELVELAYARGLIIDSRRTRGGVEGDHFLVCPPLIITEAQIDELMAILIDALDAFAAAHDLPVQAEAAA